MGRHYERGLWDRLGVSDGKRPVQVRLIQVSNFIMNVSSKLYKQNVIYDK